MRQAAISNAKPQLNSPLCSTYSPKMSQDVQQWLELAWNMKNILPQGENEMKLKKIQRVCLPSKTMKSGCWGVNGLYYFVCYHMINRSTRICELPTKCQWGGVAHTSTSQEINNYDIGVKIRNQKRKCFRPWGLPQCTTQTYQSIEHL